MAGVGGDKRRLAAALAVDLAGFTDRVAASGAGAADLAREIRALLESEVAAAGGRFEGLEGDVATARFDSAGAALGCARALLQRFAERNAGRADPLAIRAGVHLAEFVEEHGKLSGPESTIAMHIARLADPGGLTLTEPVHAQVQGQVALKGVFLPRRALRRLPGAPRVFAVPPASARYLVWAAARGGFWRHAAAALAVAALGLAATRMAWRNLAPAPAAPVAQAGVIPVAERLVNSYDNAQGLFQYAGGSSTVFWEVVPEGVKGRGARMAYRQDAGNNFWGFGTSVKQDWTPYDRVRFSLRATLPTTVRVEVVEDRGERWIADVPAGTEWQAVEIPFARFAARADFNSGERNGRLDLGMISVFVISTTSPGAGSIWIDELMVAGRVQP